MHGVLAMHMANELLDVPTAVGTLVVAAVAVAVAAMVLRRRLPHDRLPLMGVMGAFVFAAQMINFTLPGMPGTSGHLGGGVLLAVLLGPAAGVMTMVAILIIQCLIFQDGGLLALGCNVINMGVVPCVVGWWLYRLVAGRGQVAWRAYVGAWLACLVGVTAGAALVPVESWLAGRLAIPIGDFLAVMVGVHLIIGAVEGAITFAVIAYLRQVRPSVLGLARAGKTDRLGAGVVAATLLVTAGLLAGVVSWFASAHPDGLEWSYQEHRYGETTSAVKEPQAVMARVDEAHGRYAPLPDYTTRQAPLGQAPAEEPAAGEAAHEAAPDDASAGDEAASPVDGWGSLAGLIGTVVTLAVVWLTAWLLRRRRPVAPSAAE